MIDPDTCFVLGARDPEMREIARVVQAQGCAIAAATQGPAPVQARTAYEADGTARLSRAGRATPIALAPGRPLVFVECTLRRREPVARIDHHHPGDPGYDMPPERYLEGSSLGQVLRLFGLAADENQRLLAAADHCLTAAYRGQCPGIDPHELLFQRAAWRAFVTGRSLCDVIEGILAAGKAVERRFDSDRAESVFADPTEVPRDLAEGAAYSGRAIRYRELLPGGEVKEMLKGAAPGHIERFMAEHRSQGRTTYGNPHRGYAGAYLG